MTPSDVSKYKCSRCKQKSENDYFACEFADPRGVPAHLPQLTFMEEQLIARVYVNQYVYFRRSDTIASKGHCINFQQDPSEIANDLPRLAADICVIVIRKIHLNGTCQELKVRRNAVQTWLYWLKENHPQYRNVNINLENLKLLPDDGELENVRTIETQHEPDFVNDNPYNVINTKPAEPENEEAMDVDKPITLNEDPILPLSQRMAKSCSITNNLSYSAKDANLGNDKESIDDDSDEEEEVQNTGVPQPLKNDKTEAEKIQDFIDSVKETPNKQPLPVFAYPPISGDPLDEYKTINLASMAFPTLFPYGYADPFGVHNRHAEETLRNKVRHLIHYMEIIDGERVCRFAKHTRFILWIYNILNRHALMAQGDIYLQQKPEDANQTIQQLKDLLNVPTSKNEILKNMQRYMKNISGTPSYWYAASKDLDSIIKCKGGPHIFFTFTFANNHDPDLHKYLNIPEGSSAKHIKHVMNNFPHLVNWYFTKKFNEYRSEFLEKALNGSNEKGGWIWFRYEWQHRKIIHCHGLMRMGNAPDTYELNDKCNLGYTTSLLPQPLTKEQAEIVRIGKESEKEIIAFYDSLICCDAELSHSDWQKCKPTSKITLPMKIKRSDLGPEWCGNVNLWEKDRLDLTLLLQYHQCKHGGCIKIVNNIAQPCRFKHPKPLSDETKIIYNRFKYKNSDDYAPWEMEIIGKRVNNARVTNHNVDTLINWRANHDFSLVYNYRKVEKYVTKYSTKPEKKSDAFKSAFVEVVSKTSANSTNTQNTLKKIMNKVLGERDISDHEALHQLTGLPLHESNITVVKINLDHNKQIRFKGNDIEFVNSAIDNYAQRSEFKLQSAETLDIMEMSFIEFCYKFADQLKNKNLVLRSNANKVAFNFLQSFSGYRRSQQYWLHCKYNLIKYKPWENNQNSLLGADLNNNNLLDTNENWIQAWHDFLLTPKAKSVIPQHIKTMEDAQALLELEIEDEDAELNAMLDDDREKDADFKAQWMGLKQFNDETELQEIQQNHSIEYWAADRQFFNEKELGEIKNWVINEKRKDSENPQTNQLRPIVLETQLNDEQKVGYKLLEKHIRENKKNKEQFSLRLEGTAGTGKSHLINAWCHLIGQELGPNTFQVAAPTGRAAHNVGGMTLHKLLSIGVNEDAHVPDLKGNALNALQERLKDMQYLIIDEISMVGCKGFELIDRRLRQAKCEATLLFGGINLIVVGDMKQLPPICDTELSDYRNDRRYSERVRTGMYAFDCIENVVILEKVMRQSDPAQQAFRDMLMRLRSGECINSDYDMLQTRFVSYADSKTIEAFKSATFLYNSKAKVAKHNDDQLARLGCGLNPQDACRIDALHLPMESKKKAQAITSDKMMGLESSVFLARGARIMISQNVWVEKGLANGACGIIKHIIYAKNVGPPNLPEAIIVEMDEGYTGPCLEGKPRCIALNVVSSWCHTYKDGKVERHQIPLRLAFAVTIHKCQGNIGLNIKLKGELY
jgi:ATP-dependent DNA helicase PIF1